MKLLQSNQEKNITRLLAFVLPALFFLAVYRISHLKEVFTFNIVDEGVSLSTAFLHSKGFVLYKQISSDQPPLLTLLLSPLMKAFGPSAYYARILILAISSLLIWALFKIISKAQNYWSALFAAGLLISISDFVYLSVTVTRGLPAIALAILSVYSIILYQEGYKKRYVILSACFLALALEMKIYVIIFLPAVLGQIMIIQEKKGNTINTERPALSAALLWATTLALLLLYISFIATSIDFSQLYQPYARAKHVVAWSQYTGYFVLEKWLRKEHLTVLLALGALILTKKERRGLLLMPAISLTLGILLVATHYPVWSNYQPLILVPLCWLASFSFYRLFNKENWAEMQSKDTLIRIKSIAISVFLLCVLTLSVARMSSKYARLERLMHASPDRVSPYGDTISLMEKYGKYVDKDYPFVVTDSPIFPFYAKLPAHPRLANFCRRMLECGLVTADDFIGIIHKEKPPMVIFAMDWDLHDRVAPYLKKDYILTHKYPALYVRKNIAARAQEE